MSAPVEVTPEIRRAVLDAECVGKGHLPSLNRAFRATNFPTPEIGGPQGQEPHIYCDRCGLVWLLVAEPGDGYDDAVVRFDARLKSPPTRPGRPGPAGRP